MSPQFTASSKMLFLSDVHLGAFTDARNRQIEEEIIQLIKFSRSHNFSIAILGDFFDYWMEYSTKIPTLGKRMLQHFHTFNQSSPVLYITGNHDNWTLGHFTELGFDVEPNYRLYTINGKNILFFHGDAIGPNLNSLTRPFWHRVIRNKVFLKIYRGLLSPKTGLSVMKKFSEMNRQMDQEEAGHMKLDDWAKTILKEKTIDVILCGHDHVPRIRAYEGGTYINAGSFYDHRTLILYNKGNFDLVTWNAKKNNFIPFQPLTNAV
jgi:UDP-2,3-diacylglucosamine pyrophosphatase LpxH